MKHRTSCALLLSLLAGNVLEADTVVLESSKDNTLFEQANGTLSNGSGSFIFAGLSRQPEGLQTRRAALAFDIAGTVPAGATITSATLTIRVTRSISNELPSTLHRLTADWGEGASDANGQEGTGTAAQDGDATWIHSFSPDTEWDRPGGDFVTTASATTEIGAVGTYDWSSTLLADDVQDMLDNPGDNFGWLILCDEETFGGAKQIASRENTDSPVPVLEIEFEPRDTAKAPVATPVGLALLGLALLGGAARIGRRRSMPA